MAEEFDVTQSIDKVKKHVGDNPDELESVLEAEKARGDDARSTLVDWLEKQVEAKNAPAEPEPVEVSANPTTRIAGEEYEVDPLKGYRRKAGRPA